VGLLAHSTELLSGKIQERLVNNVFHTNSNHLQVSDKNTTRQSRESGHRVPIQPKMTPRKKKKPKKSILILIKASMAINTTKRICWRHWDISY
jgi:hypothetical protein